MIKSYSSIYNLGHRATTDLLKSEVIVEEKIDGSQFSFGIYLNSDGEKILKCRSKGADINLVAPERMFQKATEEVQRVKDFLQVGWTYRSEYLAKPKHSTLCYNRTPKNNIIIFDIDTQDQNYLPPAEKFIEAKRVGFECIPILFQGIITDIQYFRDLLKNESCLGGQKIEGVVIKNYSIFGPDKKTLMGKFVSEAFKEVHSKEWKTSNPSGGDIIQKLIDEYKTPARWAKAVQHLRELGQIEDSPTDIGSVLKEIPKDIEKECSEEIKDKIWEWAWPKISRGVKAGFPEWYKEELLKKQFEQEDLPS